MYKNGCVSVWYRYVVPSWNVFATLPDSDLILELTQVLFIKGVLVPQKPRFDWTKGFPWMLMPLVLASKSLLNLSTNSLMNLSCFCWSSPIILVRLGPMCACDRMWFKRSQKYSVQYLNSSRPPQSPETIQKKRMTHSKTILSPNTWPSIYDPFSW